MWEYTVYVKTGMPGIDRVRLNDSESMLYACKKYIIPWYFPFVPAQTACKKPAYKKMIRKWNMGIIREEYEKGVTREQF